MRRLRPYAANTGSELRWREITPPTSGVPRLNLRELWDYRDLAFILAKRELQLTYRQTLLGVAWVVLQPLVGTIVFSVVFGQLAQLPSDGVPYAAFVLTGLTVWMFVSGAVSSAADRSAPTTSSLRTGWSVSKARSPASPTTTAPSPTA